MAIPEVAAAQMAGGFAAKQAAEFDADPLWYLIKAFGRIGVALLVAGLLAAVGGKYLTQASSAALADEQALLEADIQALVGTGNKVSYYYPLNAIPVNLQNGQFDTSAVVTVDITLSATGAVVETGTMQYVTLQFGLGVTGPMMVYTPTKTIAGQLYRVNLIFTTPGTPGSLVVPVAAAGGGFDVSLAPPIGVSEEGYEVVAGYSPSVGWDPASVVQAAPQAPSSGLGWLGGVLGSFTGFVDALSNLPHFLFVTATSIPHLALDAIVGVGAGAVGEVLTALYPYLLTWAAIFLGISIVLWVAARAVGYGTEEWDRVVRPRLTVAWEAGWGGKLGSALDKALHLTPAAIKRAETRAAEESHIQEVATAIETPPPPPSLPTSAPTPGPEEAPTKPAVSEAQASEGMPSVAPPVTGPAPVVNVTVEPAPVAAPDPMETAGPNEISAGDMERGKATMRAFLRRQRGEEVVVSAPLPRADAKTALRQAYALQAAMA